MFQSMLDKAIGSEPFAFANFDRTKNVQDQLQEMVEGHPLEVLDRFHTFCMWDENFEDTRENLLPVSFEQLWLAFLYDQKYNKYWDGDDWVFKEED